MKKQALLGLMIPGLVVALAGCSSAKQSTTPPADNPAAIQDFLHNAKPHVDTINQEFTDQSNLVVNMSVKKVTYSAFKSQYDKDLSTLNTELQAVKSISPKSGAETFKDKYVALLSQGVQLMQDQENAMKSDGTEDPAKASKVKTELQNFKDQYTSLQNQYHFQ